MTETRSIQDEARRSRDIADRGQQAATAQERIVTLQNELEEASRLMRHDQLTGALNRRGLEDGCSRPRPPAPSVAAPARRRAARHRPLQKLNDSLGHKVGDDAWCIWPRSCASICVRRTCAATAAREFVILLPETGDTDAQQALVRLQRHIEGSARAVLRWPKCRRW